MKQLQWLFLLMTITLIAIIGFQAYWLKDSYAREKQNLDIKTNAAFRQTILTLQASKLKLSNFQSASDSAKLKLDSVSITSSIAKKKNPLTIARNVTGDPPITIASLVQQKMRDSIGNEQPHIRTIIITMKDDGNAFFNKDTSNTKIDGSGSVKVAHTYKILPPQILASNIERKIFKGSMDSSFKKARDTSTALFKISQSQVDISDSLTHHLVAETTNNKKARIFIANKNSVGMELPLSALNPDRISSIQVMPEFIPHNFNSAISFDSFTNKKVDTLISGLSKNNIDEKRIKHIIKLAPKKDSIKKEYNLIYNIDSFRDSLKLSEIDSVFSIRLKEDKIFIPFLINKLDSIPATEQQSPNEVVVNFGKPVAYHYSLLNSFPFIIQEIKLPIFFSIFLIGITLLSFWLLYRNVLRQQRLAAIKNEFINNITHELKTPIATVSVAIEALKNFNAINNPLRTKEYLDISSNEMQRLSMMVDKVLTLSVFEKNKMAINYEIVQLKNVVDEVIASLKPQIEKCHATIQIQQFGNTELQADRVQLSSVVYNLVDNALKYCRDIVSINIQLIEQKNEIRLVITDNGIGIPSEYQHKIFETFFRVPHGDTHNAKGHGLGLSYVASVVDKHHGTIKVESKVDEGTTFVITFPKQTI
jgi:two-component system, OmpR family, phosphate regulon sensor histidine kinase PhoR